MRILIAGKQAFDPGGVSASTDQLARLVAARGHDVAILARAEHARRPVERPKREVQRERTGGYTAYSTTLLPPGAALRRVVREVRPDVLVVNGGGWYFHDWTRGLFAAAPPDLPVALYVRDRGAIELLADGSVRPELVIANAHAHAKEVEPLGFDTVVVPSVVDPDAYRVDPTGEAVVFINPVQIKGLPIALAVAERCPDIPFHFRESWSLAPSLWMYVTERIASLGNVELFGHSDDRAEAYRRARLLLVPYQDGNRPRVVLEAQVSGIPMVALDEPALRECVGPSGILVPPDASIDVWVDAVEQLWDDPEAHERHSKAARELAAGDDVAPDLLADRFIAALESMHKGGARRPNRWSADGPAEVTVVVPVRNVAATVDQQLEALADQTFTGAWEVVIADNGSTDATRDRVRAHLDTLPNLRIVDAGAKRGVAHARNVGLRAARGDLLMICDGDDIVAPDWVERMVAALQEHPIVAGFLDVVTMNEPEHYRWLGPPSEEAPVGYGHLPYAPGGNIGMWREVFEALDGFDERLRRAEDIDFSWRASYQGIGVYSEPAAVIYRHLRTSAAGNFMAGLRGGFAEPSLYRRHRRHGMRAQPWHRVRAEHRWLLRTLPGVLAGREDRTTWLHHAGKRMGRIVGSVRAGTTYL